MLDATKAKIAVAPRPDFEYAMLRVLLAAIILANLASHVARDGMIARSDGHVLIVVFAFFAFACAIALQTVFAPGISRASRIIGIVVDNSIITYAMLALGEAGAVLLGAYLFVTIGNGFRYGRGYLYFSQFLSIAGFSLVMDEPRFWSQHVSVGVGFLMALLVIPLYVGSLAQRLVMARRRAEDALEAMKTKSG